MKRFVIYFYFSPRELLDETSFRMLKAIRRETAGGLLVVNGTLPVQNTARVRSLGMEVLLRKNSGYDVGAYREALFTLGRERLSAYDELILMNHTIAGPVTSLSDTFAQMDAQPDLDFWGLTCHYAMKSRRFRTEYGYVPTHIQSHFIAVRKRLLVSDVFWDYWTKMKLPRNYDEAVGFHEARFTRHFADLGYRWAASVDTEDLQNIFINPIMGCPLELLRNRGCPVFKRRSFFTDYSDELRRTTGQSAAELYDYLKKETEYPVDLLLQEMLPTQPLQSMALNLHWRRWIVPQNEGTPCKREDLLLLYRQPEKHPDSAAQWYARQTAEWFLQPSVQAEVQAMFDSNPRLALVSPEVPVCKALIQARRRAWNAALPELKELLAQQGVQVPYNIQEPLYVPFAHCAVVRKSAFENLEAVPRSDAQWYFLPLWAQSRGWFSMAVFGADQAGAQAATLAAETQLQGNIPAAVRILGRAVKSSWKEKHNI